MDYHCYNIIVTAWIALAIIIFPLLIRVKAPYGRHSSRNWGHAGLNFFNLFSFFPVTFQNFIRL